MNFLNGRQQWRCQSEFGFTRGKRAKMSFVEFELSHFDPILCPLLRGRALRSGTIVVAKASVQYNDPLARLDEESL